MSSTPPLTAPGSQSRQASFGNPLAFASSFGPISPDLNISQFRGIHTPAACCGNKNDGKFNDPTKPWTSGEKHNFPLERKKDPWKDCHELVKKYDRALCNGWTDEINNLLILTGLFSAVVTSFIVESYQWLQADSGDYSYLALLHISGQLAADPANSTARAAFVPPAFHVDRWVLYVNICWVLSLILALTTALIGILVIQWLREYERGANLAPKEALALRQMLHEGLKSWHVPKILSALPLLLQTALVLFFLGLLILLWNIHRAVAGVAAAFLGVAFIFVCLTTVMPTLQFLLPLNNNLRVPQCPYKSLQSWAFFRTVSTLTWLLSARIIPLGVDLIERFLKRWFPSTLPTSTTSSSESTDPEDPARGNPLRRQNSILIDFTDTMNNMKKWYLSWWRYEDKMWKIPSWEGFDRYWRYTRDNTESKDGQHDASSNGHYDTIRGLQWVNKKLPLGVDATYVIHPCLLDLDVPVAVDALHVLSRSSKADSDQECSLESNGNEPDSLNWLLQFYKKTKSGVDSLSPHKSESDPLHKDMVSLLAVRHLNSDSILHPDVRNHYLEMYVRIRNAGEDVKPFFEHPLRHITRPDTDINNLPESQYLQKMFEWFDIHVPDETMLQILLFLLNDVRSARLDDFEPRLIPSAGEPQQQSVLEQEQWVKFEAIDEQSKLTHDRLREKWKLMQPVWKVLAHVVKHRRGPIKNTSALVLEHCFLLCDEIIQYISLLDQDASHDTRHIDEVREGLCMLYDSISDADRNALKSYKAGFDRLRDLANIVHRFFVGPQVDTKERKRWKDIESYYLRQDSVQSGKNWTSYFGRRDSEIRSSAGPGVESAIRDTENRSKGDGHAAELSGDTLVEDSMIMDK